jgi:hypothetical protein
MVHSDRTNHSYLNPLTDSRISPSWYGFVGENDEEWGGETCSRPGSTVTLGRSIITSICYICYYFVYLSCTS